MQAYHTLFEGLPGVSKLDLLQSQAQTVPPDLVALSSIALRPTLRFECARLKARAPAHTSSWLQEEAANTL